MNFGKKSSIESYAIEKNLADKLYGEGSLDPHHKLLSDICIVLDEGVKDIDQDFICLVEQKAINAFVSFANEVYTATHNEATGVIVGYYLHHPQYPNKKIVVATNFLQATGNASSVTCEFSYEDSIRHSKYCDTHLMLPVIWIHSHPGFGVFYSSTDSSTLKHYFACSHQVGIVVDNLQDKYMGFKIYEGKQCVEDIYSFNIESCLNSHKLILTKLNESSCDRDSTKKKSPVSFKHLADTTQTPTTKGNNSISFQMLQRLSSQLSAIESDKTVNTLKKCVDDLSQFVRELKHISTSKSTSHNSSNYSVEDMRMELSIQINEVIRNINTIFESLKTEFSIFNSLGSEIEELKIEVKSLRGDISNSNTIQNVNTKEERKKSIRNWFNRFLMSYNTTFSIRELLWIFVIIILAVIVIKLKFMNQ